VEISISHLSHEFPDARGGQRVQALDDVSLTIATGEFVTLVGPSGCGKSTLLKAVAGLLRPTSGEIRCGEAPVTGPGRDRGMVFQDLAIMPWRSVRRNIAHGLEIQRVPRHERDGRVTRLIELMNLTGFEHRYPHELSGGMKQRVAVARTWAADPPVILMDEPFAATDAQTRITLQEELLRIWRLARHTVLFITHNTEEAVFLGDRVVVMSRRPGTIKAIIDIPTPHEARGAATLLSDPDIHERHEHILKLVREEVA